MTTTYLSVIPTVLAQQSLAALLGPLSILAVAAVAVVFAVLILGMVAEHRDARALTPVMIPVVAPRRRSRAAA